MELNFVAGGGGLFAGSRPEFDRAAGPLFVGGIEVARPANPGLMGRLSLRAEGGVAKQELSGVQTNLEGDVQTVYAALAVRVTLVGGGERARPVGPYLVAGAAWARPSTRVALREDPRTTPGARFEQISHENVPGAVLGAGVLWRGDRVALSAEARWMSLATAGATTSTLPLLVTIAVPLRR